MADKLLFTIDEDKLVKYLQKKLKYLGISQDGKYDGVSKRWEKTETVLYVIKDIEGVNTTGAPAKIFVSMFNTGWVLKFEFSVNTKNGIKPYSAFWDLESKCWHKISDPLFFTVIESVFLDGKREDELSTNWEGDEFTEDVKAELQKLGCYEYAD